MADFRSDNSVLSGAHGADRCQIVLTVATGGVETGGSKTGPHAGSVPELILNFLVSSRDVCELLSGFGGDAYKGIVCKHHGFVLPPSPWKQIGWPRAGGRRGGCTGHVSPWGTRGDGDIVTEQDRVSWAGFSLGSGTIAVAGQPPWESHAQTAAGGGCMRGRLAPKK